MRKPSTKARKQARKEMAPARLDLARALAEFRERTGLSQIATATFLGCDQTQVSRWSRGDKCAVPLVAPMLALGMRASVPLVLASLEAPEPADALALVGRVVELDERWRWNPPRTLGRLAALASLVAVFEPGALAAPRVRPSTVELLGVARFNARMAREKGNEENARRWDAMVARFEAESLST